MEPGSSRILTAPLGIALLCHMDRARPYALHMVIRRIRDEHRDRPNLWTGHIHVAA